MTIAHVAALYRRDAKRRRKHGVKCKRLVLAHSVNEWASTNQLRLFFRENENAEIKRNQQDYQAI